ncbi:hypothetical protein BDA96_01G070500 [Sorghum bicolor]|uniref:Uncharacterized protein n=2 Tax=Sorghum bicolor TaxID=4558 RepID=A0A921UXG6_SORBI|nr:hypothetical protein BDA96_01G070500 [Sorghum bicolor]OQU90889.1 hypothetical protein SORBI_3001G068132 [Sorghum bicolor]
MRTPLGFGLWNEPAIYTGPQRIHTLIHRHIALCSTSFAPPSPVRRPRCRCRCSCLFLFLRAIHQRKTHTHSGRAEQYVS